MTDQEMKLLHARLKKEDPKLLVLMEKCFDAGVLSGKEQAQRIWVGLTDGERNHARQAVTYSQLAMTASEWTEAVQIETERRLREKNNA